MPDKPINLKHERARLPPRTSPVLRFAMQALLIWVGRATQSQPQHSGSKTRLIRLQTYRGGLADASGKFDLPGQWKPRNDKKQMGRLCTARYISSGPNLQRTPSKCQSKPVLPYDHSIFIGHKWVPSPFFWVLGFVATSWVEKHLLTALIVLQDPKGAKILRFKPQYS